MYVHAWFYIVVHVVLKKKYSRLKLTHTYMYMSTLSCIMCVNQYQSKSWELTLLKWWRMASYVGRVGKIGRRQEGHCFCRQNAWCMECGNEWVWKLVGADSENAITRKQHTCETKQSIGAELTIVNVTQLKG